MFIQPLEWRRLFTVNLDPGFGQDGYATLGGILATRNFSNGFAMHVMDDDRVYMAAEVTGAQGQATIGLVRWTADGALDTTFGGGDGFVTTSIPTGAADDHSNPFDLAVQPDGKVLVVATALPGPGRSDPLELGVTVLRYQTDGTLDDTFGDGGIATIATPSGVSNLQVRVLAGGKIAVVGLHHVVSEPVVVNHAEPLFARFNADGSPDTSFGGGDGLATFDVVTHLDGFIYDIHMGPSGEAFAVLSVIDEGNLGELVVRFSPDGEHDTSFVADPDLPFDNRSSNGVGDLDVQDDGKLLLTGSFGSSTASSALIARVNLDGSLDPTFGDAGLVVGPRSIFEQAWIMSGGEILTRSFFANNHVFHRFDADGEVSDPLWSSGVLIHPQTGSMDAGVQTNGQIILGGVMNVAGGDEGFPFPWGLARVSRTPAPFDNANPVSLVLPGGTSGNDVVTVTVGSTTIDVVANGTPSQFPRNQFSHMLFEGLGGDDRLTVTGNMPLIANGGSGDDTITGGAGADAIDGADGADSLAGGAGMDTLRGEAGADALSGGDGADSLAGDDGDDTLDGGQAADALDGGDDHDLLRGGAADDSLSGGAGDDVLFGGDGHDMLAGAAGADSVFGEGGNDRINGNEDSDLLHGGAGTDRLSGDNGFDRLYGGEGSDFLSGNGGPDRLVGHAGVDKLYGNGGDDTLDGGDAADFLWGHDGDDSLDGGGGTDRLFAHAGNDTIRGGHGNDHLDGGEGLDLMSGYGGNDTFIANDGAADTVQGGPGDDEAETDELLDVIEGVEVS